MRWDERGQRNDAAVIQDPKTSYIGLEVITNDKQAVEYVLSLMERYRIVGRGLLKP